MPDDLITRVERAIRHAHDTSPQYRHWHAAAVAAIEAVAAHYREQRPPAPYVPMVANSYRREAGR